MRYAGEPESASKRKKGNRMSTSKAVNQLKGKEGGVTSLKWRGTGVAGSPTAGWIYDYQAYLAPKWKKATDKTPILIGSVLRVVAHGGAPAGVTGTFYLVKLA
jgi:hypothetical protein